jgi:hypothetical protein
MKYLLIALSIIFLTGCQVDNSSLMPNISGRAYELIVVMEDEHWDGHSGDSIIKYLGKNIVGLPQEEPVFDLVQIPPKAFSEIFKTHRNIIRVKISSQINEPKVYMRKDVYAKPQMLVQIEAGNIDEFINLFIEHSGTIENKLLLKERNRIIGNYKRFEDINIGTTLRDKHGLKLTFPRGFTYDMDTSNFIWVSHETRNVSQGVFIYYYNYTDTTAFDKENLISSRDRYLRAFVHGQNKGSYMSTEKRILPAYREFLRNNQYYTELKGLWRLEGDFMGGPFISLSTVDTIRNRVVTVEGYVYAPKNDKRNFLRQTEAILYTLEFVSPNDETAEK